MTSNTNLKIVASVVRVEVYQIDIDMNLNGSILGHVYLRFNTRFLSFGYNLVIRRIPVRACQQWRNYGRQWRQPPQGASPEGAPRDQCKKKFLTPHRLAKLHEIWSVDS